MSVQSFQDAVAAVKGNASPDEQTETAEVETEAQAETQIEEIEVQEDIDLEVIETDDSPAIDAPNSWSKAEKEHFGTLPQEVQQSIALRERERDLNIRKAQDETAATRKEIETERDAVNKLKTDYSEKLKSGIKELSSDLLDPNSETYDPEAYHLAAAKQREAQAEISKLDNELELEKAQERKVWQENEIKVYQEILPEFVDTEKGPAFRQKLAEYAVKTQGITMEQAANAFPITPAKEMKILSNSMKWEDAVARQKAAKKTPKPKALQGGNSNPQPEKKADMKSAAAKFKANRTPASAAALLSLNRKG